MSDNHEFWEAMEAYKAAFGEYFPTEACLASDAEMIETMRDCIDAGTPYDPYQYIPEGAVI